MAAAGAVHEVQLISIEDLDRTLATPGVVVLIDNSNMWIEGKKFAGKSKGLESEDPSWRIKIGNVVDTVLRGRTPALIRVFGSIPPPTDAVWEMYKQHGVSVDTSLRSRWTKKEKRVDTKFLTLLIWEAGKLPDRFKNPQGETMREELRAHRPAYVIIGGDADYLDPVKLLLHPSVGADVEVWSWKTCLNGGYKKLRAEFPDSMSIHYFNDAAIFE